MHAHLLTVLFHFTNNTIPLKPCYFTSPKLFKYNAQLAPYIFQWADYAGYYYCKLYLARLARLSLLC